MIHDHPLADGTIKADGWYVNEELVLRAPLVFHAYVTEKIDAHYQTERVPITEFYGPLHTNLTANHVKDYNHDECKMALTAWIQLATMLSKTQVEYT